MSLALRVCCTCNLIAVVHQLRQALRQWVELRSSSQPVLR